MTGDIYKHNIKSTVFYISIKTILTHALQHPLLHSKGIKIIYTIAAQQLYQISYLQNCIKLEWRAEDPDNKDIFFLSSSCVFSHIYQGILNTFSHYTCVPSNIYSQLQPKCNTLYIAMSGWQSFPYYVYTFWISCNYFLTNISTIKYFGYNNIKHYKILLYMCL